ncbi:MAG: enoyl-CoA hydratase, partial [Burkholderiales bacterium]|nr:enoyl-CoA hydratase [Burkholderiales bacterium]
DEFGAQEAHNWGLVQEVAAPEQVLERALTVAERIARQSPVGVRATLASSRMAREQGDTAAFASMMASMQACVASDDAVEGLNAFLERREPNFR